MEPKGYKIYPVSAATLEGIDELKYAAWDLLMNTEDSPMETFDEEHIHHEEVTEDEIIVRKEDGAYIVEGGILLKDF